MKKGKKVILCLLVASVFIMPISAMKIEEEANKATSTLNSGMFRQLPDDPCGHYDWWGGFSNVFTEYKAFDDFWGVTNPIRSIQWWSLIPTDEKYNISFHLDDNGLPGDVVCIYVDVVPSMTTTEIMYEDLTGLWELVHFEHNLESPYCKLSEGWISIQGTTNTDFFWLSSSDGNNKCFHTPFEGGDMQFFDYDLAFILSDSTESNLEINVKGGFGCTVEITNTGTETMDNVPVNIDVLGGRQRNDIKARMEETISSLAPSETKSFSTGMFFGFGKIILAVCVDDYVIYKTGFQLLIFTLI